MQFNERLLTDVALMGAQHLMDGPGRYVPEHERDAWYELVIRIQRALIEAYVIFYQRMLERDDHEDISSVSNH